MANEFSEVLAELSEKDRDILACANVLGVRPSDIMKVEWKEHEGHPQPYVTVRIHAHLKSRWETGRFPWSDENLPQEKTREIEEFLQTVKARKFFRG